MAGLLEGSEGWFLAGQALYRDEEIEDHEECRV
jgi:hypothetical protein